MKSMVYVVIVLGIVLWLLLVFNVLVGLRVVVFKGALHAKVHRWIAYVLVLGGLTHAMLTVGTLVFGWFS